MATSGTIGGETMAEDEIEQAMGMTLKKSSGTRLKFSTLPALGQKVASKGPSERVLRFNRREPLLGAKRALGVCLAALCAASVFAGTEGTAHAQEILLTGPLAGAPAVRNLRLYRKGRLEFAPAISFTLLDEYKRQMFVGARLNYNITDWLAVGGWGGFSPDIVPFQNPTDLVDKIQDQNEARRAADGGGEQSLDRRLTQINMGPNFADQLGTIDWTAAPQLTLVPFRGKIAIFQSIYADTDFYFFGGPAFVGVTERADCDGAACSGAEQGVQDFEMAKRTAIAPTFGAGFTFYVNRWNSFGFEWRALPFARNTGGFDNRGRDPDAKFPDRKISSDDREFKFNQMLTISWGFYLPLDYKVSE